MPGIDSSDRAKVLSSLGASKGGRARSQQMTATERRALARKAALARWGKAEPAIVRSTHEGDIPFGDLQIPCVVLEDGTRLISERGVVRALGSTRRQVDIAVRLSNVLSDRRLQFLISENFSGLEVQLNQPIIYRARSGKIARGRAGAILPRICQMWVSARLCGFLNRRQSRLAESAQVLLSRIEVAGGFEAFLDEVTHFEEVRAREQILASLAVEIDTELFPWVHRFPDEFFRLVYKLEGRAYKPGPAVQHMARLINEFVFKQLKPGVLDGLKREKPALSGDYRPYEDPEFPAADTGNRYLDLQITMVTTVMCLANQNSLAAKLAEVFPKARPLFESAQSKPRRPLRHIDIQPR